MPQARESKPHARSTSGPEFLKFFQTKAGPITARACSQSIRAVYGRIDRAPRCSGATTPADLRGKTPSSGAANAGEPKIPCRQGLNTGRFLMKAIVVTDEAAGTAGMTLVERPEPDAAVNDVVVQVHASGFTPGELTWPSNWA